MAQRTQGAETGDGEVRLPTGVVLKPPSTLEDLKADTEYDPEGTEEFVGVDPGTAQRRVAVCFL